MDMDRSVVIAWEEGGRRGLNSNEKKKQQRLNLNKQI